MATGIGEVHRGRRWLLVGAAFCLGLCAGVELTALLAAKSHRAFLEASLLLFATKEDVLLEDALRSNDIEGALLHAGAKLEVSRGDAYEMAFGPARPDWAIPWALREVLSAEGGRDADAVALSEAVYRAHLAVLWERLGNQKAAEREFARIALVTGRDDPARWRELGEQQLKMKARSPR